MVGVHNLLFPSLHIMLFSCYFSCQSTIISLFQAAVLLKGWRWEGRMTLFYSNDRGAALSLSKLPRFSGRTVKVLVVITIAIRFDRRLGGSCNNLKKKKTNLQMNWQYSICIRIYPIWSYPIFRTAWEEHNSDLHCCLEGKLAQEPLENHLTASR